MRLRRLRLTHLGALFVWALLYSVAAVSETVRVTHVFDGDTVRLADGRDIRLIGINAPETAKKDKNIPDEPLANDAREALSRLINGGEIRLEYGAERHDRHRRTLAHAFLPDGRSIEVELLKKGLAFLIVQPPNVAHLSEHQAAEAEARRAGRGVWNHPYYKPRDAASLTLADAGFRVIEGRVQRIGRGKRNYYFDLTERVTLVVPFEHWPLFGGTPQRFVGQRVVVRGWIAVHENRLRMRLSHPVMLEMVN